MIFGVWSVMIIEDRNLGVTAMPRKPKYKVLYAITEEDVYNTAKEMDLPKEKITPEVMREVREALDEGMNDWSYIIETALYEALDIEKKEEE
jgi:hypothetical protein